MWMTEGLNVRPGTQLRRHWGAKPMDSVSGDTEESTEGSPGQKRSQIKSLKSCLYGRTQRAGEEGNSNLSQSVRDITAGRGLGSDGDLTCSPGRMGSRAVSLDSVFLADPVLTDAEPDRVFSQENVHSRIKTLQMKLQEQKMHLGPPPLVLPVRQQADLDSRSKDGSSRQAPAEVSVDGTTQAAHSKMISQLFSSPSPILKSTPLKPAVQTTFSLLPASVISHPVVTEPPVDFSSPSQFSPCLNNSGAHHRMSVRPKNQRASTRWRFSALESKSHVETLNNIDRPAPVTEDELCAQEKVTMETQKGSAGIFCTPEGPPSKSPEDMFITTEETSILPSLTLPKPVQVPAERVPSVTPQVLRADSQMPADVISSEPPHSSFMQSGLKDKGEEGFEKPPMTHDDKDTVTKADMIQASSDQLSAAFSSEVTIKSSSVHQQIQIMTESTRVIKRTAQGSGSVQFSITAAKNRSGERPQSSSFMGLLEQTEARQRLEDIPFSSMKEKGEHRDIQPKEGPIAVRTHKTSGVPWDKKDSLKKGESVASKNTTISTSTVKLESSQEVVEQAVEAWEAEEDEGKAPFGIKLRSTSHSMRRRANASSVHNVKSSESEDQCDKQKGREIINNGSDVCKMLSTNISCAPSTSRDLGPTDQPSPGSSAPLKYSSPLTCNLLNMPKELETTYPNPKQVDTAFVAHQDPKPAPPTAPFEVSWMSIAREKTKSLQQLFTSKFPREFPSMQAAARPPSQVQTSNEAETLTGTKVKTQTVTTQQNKTPLEPAKLPSTDVVQAEKAPSRSEVQPGKQSLISVQQKASGTSSQPNISQESQASKRTDEPQSHSGTNPSASQSASAQNNNQATQSPANWAQTETHSSVAKGSIAQANLSSSQHQPAWKNECLHPISVLKATSSPLLAPTTSSETAPAVLRTTEGEASMQQKEGTSVRYALWTGSVSQRSAFLERRAEWTTPPATKEVEMKKDQTVVLTASELPTSDKSPPLTKETKPEGIPWINPKDTDVNKASYRPREEKWPRKNVPSSSSPSSSSPMTDSDSGQPSWMELAKRKSMAWSDKSMD